MRGRGRKIQKQKRKTIEDEGSSKKVNKAYWKKFNIWYRKLRYWMHNSVPHCIDFMYVEKNVCEILVETLLNVPGKTKDGMDARLDLAELGIKPELFARQEEDKTTLPPFVERYPTSGYHKATVQISLVCIPPDKHVTNENEDGKPLSVGKSSEVSREVFQKAHLYVIHNIDEIVHISILETKNPSKRIALLENEHSKSFAKWLCEEVERELAISKDSVSETVRWISYGPRATIVKYEAYNINGYTFRTKSNDGIVYQNSGVSVEAVDLHISKEVATTRKAFYYGVLQEIWVLDYRFRQIPLFKCDWVNHKAGGVKHDPNLGYTLVDLNSLGHKDDPFILASQARQVFYVKDQIDKKLSIVFGTPTKNYKDTYDEVNDEFSTVIHKHNDNILPCVNRRDLAIVLLYTKFFLEQKIAEIRSWLAAKDARRGEQGRLDGLNEVINDVLEEIEKLETNVEILEGDADVVFVSKAIIRRDLHLEDAEGVKCLPNNEIFKELARMGMVRNVDSLSKFLIYPRFIQVFLENQVDDMTSHHNKYTSPALTQKVFANMRRLGKGFFRNETPLFDTMLVQPQTQADEDVEMPVDKEQTTTTSALSTSELQDQPSTPHNSPKQEPTHSSPHDSPHTNVNPPRGRMFSNIYADAEISLVDKTQRLDDDLIFDIIADLGGKEVDVKPAETGVSHALDVEVSAAEPIVTTVSSLVTTDSVTITAVEPVSAAAKELTDIDMTMAKALTELKTSKPKLVTTVLILNSTTTVTTIKPKAKGITIQEPLVTQKIAISFISSSKGKAIMIESEKPVKIKDLTEKDEQVAKDIHDKIQVELEEEAKREEEASMAAVAKLYDVVQAQIYADQELAA
ncbi:hypothetical protein Tco_1534005 [Tanacetum coccineum]